MKPPPTPDELSRQVREVEAAFRKFTGKQGEKMPEGEQVELKEVTIGKDS